MHNLQIIDWRSPDSGYDWADTANAKIKKFALDGDYKSLINYHTLGREIELSVPSPEHYLPLLYVLGIKEKNESIEIYNDKTVMGSISMSSFKIE